MGDNEFRCESCGDVFEKSTPEPEALAELAQCFPGTPVEECGLVCDDCWEKYYRPEKLT